MIFKLSSTLILTTLTLAHSSYPEQYAEFAKKVMQTAKQNDLIDPKLCSIENSLLDLTFLSYSAKNLASLKIHTTDEHWNEQLEESREKDIKTGYNYKLELPMIWIQKQYLEPNDIFGDFGVRNYAITAVLRLSVQWHLMCAGVVSLKRYHPDIYHDLSEIIKASVHSDLSGKLDRHSFLPALKWVYSMLDYLGLKRQLPLSNGRRLDKLYYAANDVLPDNWTRKYILQWTSEQIQQLIII